MKNRKAKNVLDKLRVAEAKLAQTQSERLRDERKLQSFKAYESAVEKIEWLESQVIHGCAPIWRLVDLGNLIAAKLASIEKLFPIETRVVACTSASWPVSISDTPRLAKDMKQLLTKLEVGRNSGEPFDPIKARRWQSPAKALAVELSLVIKSIKELNLMHEEVRFFRKARSQERLREYLEFRRKTYAALEERVHSLCKLLRVKNPFPSGIALLRFFATISLPRSFSIKGSQNEWSTTAVAILWAFTRGRPEKSRAIKGKIAKSKAEVYKRTYGKDSSKIRASNIQAGIRSELKQAFNHLV